MLVQEDQSTARETKTLNYIKIKYIFNNIHLGQRRMLWYTDKPQSPDVNQWPHTELPDGLWNTLIYFLPQSYMRGLMSLSHRYVEFKATATIWLA